MFATGEDLVWVEGTLGPLRCKKGLNAKMALATLISSYYFYPKGIGLRINRFNLQ